ncbi:MAG: ribosomal protein S18-alanine N-acetyltransferase [Proteobacteria bacterium]|nr:ribosomal protein S18-alanine N-acetyltransferase [Burkholderiales bacterium]
MSARLDPRPLTRDMCRGDLADVIEVERRIYDFPWTEGNFRDAIEAGYHASVLEFDRHLVGYRVMMIGPGEAHLLNLSIAHAWQRRGFGRHLLLASMREARLAAALTMFLEVRPSNAPGIALYGDLGFRQVGVRKGYYPAADGREDAWVMSLPL